MSVSIAKGNLDDISTAIQFDTVAWAMEIPGKLLVKQRQ